MSVTKSDVIKSQDTLLVSAALELFGACHGCSKRRVRGYRDYSIDLVSCG